MANFDIGSKRNAARDKFAPKEKNWQKHERRTAKTFKGRTQPGSGSKPMFKGDVWSDEFLCECKSTGDRSISLKVDWLEKIHNEAVSRRRRPAMSLMFDSASGECEKTWIMVPATVFEEMFNAACAHWKVCNSDIG